jgi:putative transposase
LIDDPSAGKPRFRTDGKYDSFTYPAYNMYRLDTQGLFKGKKPRMFLGGVGWVRSSDNGIIKRVPVDRMKQAVISRKKMGKSNKWYITIFCECLEMPDNRTWYMDAETPDPVGLDLGARRVATLTDHTVVENHRTLRKNEKKLARIQRKIEKTEKGSEERRKYLGHMNHLLKRIEDSKNDLLQKATRSIAQDRTKIFVEDLSVRDLLDLQDNKESRKLFRDASAGTFMRLLRYKGEETGSEIVPVNPAYTSRICTKCGRLNEPFSQEIFCCRFCGFTKHRDDNACVNILRRGMGFDILGTSPIA